MVVNISPHYVKPQAELWQYDCNQTLEFRGMKVPDGTELQFYQGEHNSKTFVKGSSAAVPDYLLAQAIDVTAYLYIVGGNGGKTVRKITIKVKDREKPTDYVDPTPPVDYSRLLPVGGADGDTLMFGPEGPYWESDPVIPVQWENISGKPEAFPPTAHQHRASAISFEDGQSFQDKYDSGQLTGSQGDSFNPEDLNRINESLESLGTGVSTAQETATTARSISGIGDEGSNKSCFHCNNLWNWRRQHIWTCKSY